jgi:hypothetical protein
MDHPHQIKACEEAIINLENTLELVDPSPSTEPKKENSKINT